MSIVENPIRLFRIGFFLFYESLVVTITYLKMVVITFLKKIITMVIVTTLVYDKREYFDNR